MLSRLHREQPSGSLVQASFRVPRVSQRDVSRQSHILGHARPPGRRGMGDVAKTDCIHRKLDASAGD